MLGRVSTLLRDCMDDDDPDTLDLAYPWDIDPSEYHDELTIV